MTDHSAARAVGVRHPGFLGWIFVKSLGEAPWSQRWSLIGVVIAGLVVVFSARFILRSPFFQISRESEA